MKERVAVRNVSLAAMKLPDRSNVTAPTPNAARILTLPCGGPGGNHVLFRELAHWFVCWLVTPHQAARNESWPITRPCFLICKSKICFIFMLSITAHHQPTTACASGAAASSHAGYFDHSVVIATPHLYSNPHQNFTVIQFDRQFLSIRETIGQGE